jgi:beta-carotene 3-hydroxylase
MLSLKNVLLLLAGFVGMEAVTYLVHRFVMHGLLRSLHVSHHRNAAAAYASKAPEPNDMFPLAFSVIVVVGLWTGFNVTSAAWLLPLLAGVSVYGAVYTVIHDGVIHGRIRWMKRVNTGWSVRLEAAHREHHRTNSEPYGMLFPTLTMQSEVGRQRRSGSTPSQVPVDQ